MASLRPAGVTGLPLSKSLVQPGSQETSVGGGPCLHFMKGIPPEGLSKGLRLDW